MTKRHFFWLSLLPFCALHGCSADEPPARPLPSLVELLTDWHSGNEYVAEKYRLAGFDDSVDDCPTDAGSVHLSSPGGHVQLWTELYRRHGNQYFLGGSSSHDGGILFIAERPRASSVACIVWHQRLDKKGGTGFSHLDTWGYWDHPSQAAVIDHGDSTFVALTMNCWLDDCDKEDRSGIIFVNVDDPLQPYLYPTKFTSDEWIEPDVLDVTYHRGNWILAVGNAAGPDPDYRTNMMWVYHAEDLKVSDPGSTWTAPADYVKSNALLDTSIQFCGYATDPRQMHAGDSLYWLCTGGYFSGTTELRNFMWGSKVDSSGLPQNTPSSFIDTFHAQPDGKLELTLDADNWASCNFRGGASVTFEPASQAIHLYCSSWDLGTALQLTINPRDEVQVGAPSSD